MNRWWGGSKESEQQSSERDARAARRTISKLPRSPSTDSEDDYRDCDTSLIFGNVDGNDDLPSEDEAMDAAAAAAAAELTRQQNLPVEDADFNNDPESWKKELKLKFEKHDVKNYIDIWNIPPSLL